MIIKICGQNKNPYLIYIWLTSTCYTPLKHFELTVYLLPLDPFALLPLQCMLNLPHCQSDYPSAGF